MGILLNSDLRRQLAAPAVYGHLITNCFTLNEACSNEIERQWGMSSAEAYSLGCRSVPTLIGNLLASHSCIEEFGADVVQIVPGFYQFNRLGSFCVCSEFANLCTCVLPCWRLDIDFCWSKRGLLFPVLNQRGWIVGLKVFRHPMDQRPFTLRVREARAA